MQDPILTLANIAAVAALVVLFFIVLDVPATRHTKSKASAHSRIHRK